MKTIGLIGGMSWVSTVEYYTQINNLVHARLGGNHSAKVNLVSVDFAEICANNDRDDHEATFRLLQEAARTLDANKCAFMLLCANTMHMHADRIQAEITVPLLQIGEVTAAAVVGAGMKRVALLGTKYVMQGDFYLEKLTRAGLEVVTPSLPDQEYIHQAIYRELTKNVFKPETRHSFAQVIRQLQDEGAEGVILGCTEIPLLLEKGDVEIPAFDTTKLHATAAANLALA